MTAIDWEVLTFCVVPHTQASTSYPSSQPKRPSPSLLEGSGEEQERPTVLLRHSCTWYHFYCYRFGRKKALEAVLRARFGYLLAAAILSLAFSGSAGIINSGRKGLKCMSAGCEMLVRCTYVGSNLCLVMTLTYGTWQQLLMQICRIRHGYLRIGQQQTGETTFRIYESQ